LRDAKEEHDPAGVVYCLSQLADLYRQQGDLESAFRTFQQGLAWVNNISYAPLVEAEIQKDFGLFYAQIGDWDQALRHSSAASSSKVAANDPASLELVGYWLQCCNIRETARRNRRDTAAIDIAHSLTLRQEEAELLLKRASAHLTLKQQALAEADIATATKLASNLAAVPLQIEASLAWEMRGCLSSQEAEASYRRALQLAEQTGEREQQSVALVGLARAQRSEGKLEDAAISLKRPEDT